jgi:hypothetical protein
MWPISVVVNLFLAERERVWRNCATKDQDLQLLLDEVKEAQGASAVPAVSRSIFASA